MFTYVTQHLTGILIMLPTIFMIQITKQLNYSVSCYCINKSAQLQILQLRFRVLCKQSSREFWSQFYDQCHFSLHQTREIPFPSFYFWKFRVFHAGLPFAMFSASGSLKVCLRTSALFVMFLLFVMRRIFQNMLTTFQNMLTTFNVVGYHCSSNCIELVVCL